MNEKTAFEQELAVINEDLSNSLNRLQALLHKTRAELANSARVTGGAEKEHLESVVRELEKKIEEIKEIGI